jgi:hypothetical protein
MLSYGVYAVILFGSLFLLVSVGLLILFKLPLRRLAILLESVFHFKEVRNLGDQYIVIDVCGDQFEISKSILSRFPFVSALGTCLLVSILVFLEGCVFSTRHVYSNKLCPERTPNCYLFKARFTSFRPIFEFVCEPDQPTIPSNMSASYAVCYGFVLPDQSTIDILNQLGVCTGILSLVDSVYPLAYKLARLRHGRICLIILLGAMVIVEITILSIQLNVSFMTIILLTLTVVLLSNIFLLQYRKAQRPVTVSRVGSYIEMRDFY